LKIEHLDDPSKATSQGLFSIIACTYALSPQNYGFSSSSGTGSITVTASSTSCSWTATSNDSWVTVTSGASGTGSGTVGYSVAANTGTAKTGTLVIGGQTFTVTQSGIVTYTQAQLDQAVADANAAKDLIIAQKDQSIATLNEIIVQKDQTISTLNATITSMFTQQQLDQALAAANAAKDVIIAQKDQTIATLNESIIQKDQNIITLNSTIASMFTQHQLDQAVAIERMKWDINNDGKMGLEEVIYILQTMAGVR
jgi:uncharacterized protein YjgD (DUF1641 family)